MKILIADDDKGTCHFLQKFLEKKGHDVDVVFDGEAALSLVKAKNYGLLFLDQNMPELTGLEIAKYVKQNNLKMKIAIITGYPQIDEHFSKTIGADVYLEKPVRLEEIEMVVSKFENKA